MSYFIFKGKHSDDAKIIVEKLPPIVKPAKRYQQIVIDGKYETDYEVTGYEPYVKSIPIGLWNADLYRVIDWLDGEGTLILSSEPDKYYNARVVERIDYDKSLRFRKANIPFLVQPVKYSTQECETTERKLFNQGNINCFPLMTIYGSGYVGVYVNGVLVCTVNVSGYITLDGEAQDATKDGVLKNRLMVGTFPEFIPGANVLTFTGTVTNVITKVRSRWI